MSKTIALFILITVISTGFFYPAITVKAQEGPPNKVWSGLINISKGVAILGVSELAVGPICVAYEFSLNSLIKKGLGGIWRKGKGVVKNVVSTTVPTSDTEAEGQREEAQRSKTRTDCQTFLKDVIIATVKKRFLDSLVDQIIFWIQDEKNPKFITDWKQFKNDIFQASVGDIVQEIGLGAVCRPFKLHLQLSLQTPVFSKRVTCTLDKIVDNFDAFFENFENGGWIAYNHIWRPENNFYGASIIVQDELLGRTAESQSNAIARTAQGFLSTTKCVEYTTRSGTNTSSGGIGGGLDANDINQGIKDNDPDILFFIQEFGVKCTKQEITTPGRTIAAGLEKALYSDIDFIINAKELSAYLAAIADAAVNRLIKEGVGGIKGVKTPSRPPSNVIPTGYAVDPVSEDVISDILNEMQPALLEDLNTTLVSILTTQENLLTLAQDGNNLLINNLDTLISCLTIHEDEENHHASAMDNATIALALANERTVTMTEKLTEVGIVLDTVNSKIFDITSLDFSTIDSNEITILISQIDTLSTQAGNLSNEVNGTNGIISSIQTALTATKVNFDTCVALSPHE